VPPEDHAAPFHREIYNPFLDPSVTWETVPWVRSFATVPVLVKGVLVREDARRVVEAGIVVSNHGGRNLDTVPSTIEALPGVIEAVAGRARGVLWQREG
jgi:isopentenyl diphosphate isomerase/L-lactate dehydrogenase-like FMN-dependent dehydrogenase